VKYRATKLNIQSIKTGIAINMGDFIRKSKKQSRNEIKNTIRIKEINRKKRFQISKIDLYAGITIIGLSIFNAKILYRKGYEFYIYNWPDFIERLPVKLLIGFLICMILYILKILEISWPQNKNYWPENVICNKCKKSKVNDNNYKCTCGGEYEDINEYKYVE
jgi:hypothetical protein